MKTMLKTRMINFSLKYLSNFSKKQSKIQNETDARDDHLINGS